METKQILNDASDRMQKTVEHLEEELLNVRAGKASPNALNGVFVDYYGSQTPVSGVALPQAAFEKLCQHQKTRISKRKQKIPPINIWFF